VKGRIGQSPVDRALAQLALLGRLSHRGPAGQCHEQRLVAPSLSLTNTDARAVGAPASLQRFLAYVDPP